MMHSPFEEKALIDDFLAQVKKVLKLDKFKDTIDSAISEQYNSAIDNIDKELDLGINLVPSDKELNFLQNYVNDNLEAAGDQISNNIRAEIQRGIINKETTSELAKRIKLLFSEKKYQHRLKTIIRTETLRANNYGTLEGARQAQAEGVNLKKWLDVTMDEVTSNICKHEYSKYGDESKAIPLDEDFVVTVDNKTIKTQSSPFHPNCRSVLRIAVQ